MPIKTVDQSRQFNRPPVPDIRWAVVDLGDAPRSKVGGRNAQQFVLILLVASIPVAMPAVFSIIMALGALALSKEKAIVSKLSAIEEMAGVDILCSDKTGALTKKS